VLAVQLMKSRWCKLVTKSHDPVGLYIYIFPMNQLNWFIWSLQWIYWLYDILHALYDSNVDHFACQLRQLVPYL